VSAARPEPTPYEAGLIEAFRESLFDGSDETSGGASMIDPEHHDYPTILALGWSPRRRRKRREPKAIIASQEALEL
jgi:hypothetical protein